MHPVKQLLEQLQSKVYDSCPTPDGVEPTRTNDVIRGTAFFPGGYGLWMEPPSDSPPPMPIRKVMILGHNFDSKESYECSREVGHENINGPTWRYLREVLASVEIKLTDCFFTNAYMGIRLEKATGRFPRSEDFKRVCQDFLRDQIALQQPRLILTLGIHVPSFIAALTDEPSLWEKARRFADLDNTTPLMDKVAFEESPTTCSIAALTHPCLRPRNVFRRRYKMDTGDKAEKRLIKDALDAAGLS